jgi:hypothetical protein
MIAPRARWQRYENETHSAFAVSARGRLQTGAFQVAAVANCENGPEVKFACARVGSLTEMKRNISLISQDLE